MWWHWFQIPCKLKFLSKNTLQMVTWKDNFCSYVCKWLLLAVSSAHQDLDIHVLYSYIRTISFVISWNHFFCNLMKQLMCTICQLCLTEVCCSRWSRYIALSGHRVETASNTSSAGVSNKPMLWHYQRHRTEKAIGLIGWSFWECCSRKWMAEHRETLVAAWEIG